MAGLHGLYQTSRRTNDNTKPETSEDYDHDYDYDIGWHFELGGRLTSEPVVISCHCLRITRDLALDVGG